MSKESLVYSAFSPAELPAYKVFKRNSWPALVFNRDADGKVKLYGMSMEMARILAAPPCMQHIVAAKTDRLKPVV